MLQKKYLTLHAAELWVETLVAQNTIATIGGRVLVAPTNILTQDLPAAATTLTVKYNNFANGDRIYMEANGSVEFMAVTSAASGGGPYTYTVTRNLDGSGANQWYAGDALLNTGTTGKGFIDLYSTSGVLSGSGPSIVGNVRTGTTYNDYAPRWAIGNLNGIYNYGVDTYGAAFGDAANTNVTVDATNGFRIRSGTTNKFVADTSGNLSIVGDLSIGTGGSIRSGATSFTTGTGFIMEYNGGTPRFRIGNPAGDYMSWDGTTLVIAAAGSGIAVGGAAADVNAHATTISGGKITAASITATQIAATTITASNMNVSTLSAIAANLGTVTAGSISGVTATFGGGSVTLDSNGVSITNGTGTVNKVKWSDGSYLYSSGGTLVAQAAGNWALQTNGGSAQYTFSSSRMDPPGGADIGSSGSRVNILWLIDTIKWSSPPTTSSDDDPVVYSSGNAQLYRKTNGYTGTCSSPSSITIESGIVTACS
jgi:hypothetical protein